MNSTRENSARKIKKSKRSLAKHPLQTHDMANSITIDMSQQEMDDIFTGLYTGQLQNPQEAMGRVYSLALDSIEKTLIKGIADLCKDLAQQNNSNNPLAPWLSKFIPSDPDKFQAFKDNFSSKIQASKLQIQSQIRGAMEKDRDDSNVMGTPGMQAGNKIRDILSSIHEMPAIPGFHPLSDDRVRQLFNDIQQPVPDNTIPRFKISQEPGAYRFSFNTGHSNQQNPSKASVPIEIHHQTSNDDILDTSSQSSHLPQIFPDSADAHDTVQSLQTAAADIAGMASEVTVVMQEIAGQITKAAMETYASTPACPTLSQMLQNDPRFLQDKELSAFIQHLEADDDADEDDTPLDNDELAKAFGLMLDTFK